MQTQIHKAGVFTPNIFKHADKELASTAFLCWLLDHLRNDVDSCEVKDAAHGLLDKILTLSGFEKCNHAHLVDIKKDFALEGGKYLIDVYALIKLNGHDLRLFIENKVNSGLSGAKQLINYANAIEKINKSDGYTIKVYYKSKFDFNAPVVFGKDRSISGFLKLGYDEIYNVFSKFLYSSNDIIRNYSELATEYYLNTQSDISSFKNNHAGFYGLINYLFNINDLTPEYYDVNNSRIYYNNGIGFIQSGTSYGKSQFLIFTPFKDMKHFFIRLEQRSTYTILKCGCYSNDMKNNKEVDGYFDKFKKIAADHNFKHTTKLKLKKHKQTATFIELPVADNIDSLNLFKAIIKDYASACNCEICY